MPDTIPTEWRRPSVAARSEGWTLAHSPARMAVVAGLLLATVLIYWPSCRALAGFWSDTKNRTYTHGYLVLLISLWLMVRERRRLEALRLHPATLGLPLLLLLSAVWLVFWRAAVQDLHLLLLPLLLLAAIGAVLGWAAVRLLLFPIGFLYFAMPIWGDLAGILQYASVKVIGVLIWLTGLPAYLQGDLVHVPAGTLEVAQGCSGLHFLIVGLAMAALYGEITRGAIRQRLIWIGLMGVLALVANWARIFVIVVAAYATDMRSFLVTVDHYWFGWFVFAACFAAFLWMAERLAPASTPAVVARTAELAFAGPAARPSPHSRRSVFITLACLGLLPLLAYGTDVARGQPTRGIEIDWPTARGEWNGPQRVRSSRWTPEFQNATTISRRRYLDASGETVELFVVAYRTQDQHAKLLGYGNSLLGSEAPRLLDQRTVVGATGTWRQMTLVDSTGGESLLWSRYRIGDRSFVWSRASQLWYGIASLTTQPVSSLVAIRSACQPGCPAAAARLAQAAANLQPSLRLTAGAPGEG